MKNRVFIIWIVIIALIMLCVWFFAYRSIFSTSTFSTNNVDWGGFGDFFWGLGTMLLTALNVYVFYKLTIALGDAEEKRDKAALQLQQRQFEFGQKMAILNDIRSAIVALYSTREMSEELRSNIYGILNKVQILRGLFSSAKLEQQVQNIRKKVFYYDREDDELWSKTSNVDFEESIPTDNRVIIIAQDLSKLGSIIWADLDSQFNKKDKN